MSGDYPWIDIADGFKDAIDALEHAVNMTGDAFRDEDGTDWAPTRFKAAVQAAVEIVARLKAEASYIEDEVAAEETRHAEDDEFWTR